MKLLKNYRFGAKRSERKIRVSHKTKITLQTVVALSAVTIGLGAANVVTGNSGQNSPAVHAATTNNGWTIGALSNTTVQPNVAIDVLNGLSVTDPTGKAVDFTHMPTFSETDWVLSVTITDHTTVTVVYNQSTGALQSGGGSISFPTFTPTANDNYGILYSWIPDSLASHAVNVTRDLDAATATQTQYSVSFISNGGSVIDSPMVDEGSTLTRPADPTKSGYTFAGWYTDQDLTQAYDFTSPVTSNLVLYAKWTADTVTAPTTPKYTVTLENPDGTLLSSQTVTAGSPLTKPANPTKTGYTFAGWYTDKGLTTACDFTKAVTGDMTLYAKWAAVSTGSTATKPAKTVATTAKTTSAVKVNATTAKVAPTGVATKPTLPKTGEASTLPISITGLVSMLCALVIGLRRKF